MKTLYTMFYASLKKYLWLFCVLLWVTTAQATPVDPDIQRRIAEGSQQLKAMIAQNAWNNAHGFSHRNRYVFGDTKWIKVEHDAIDNAVALDKLLAQYNTGTDKQYTYNVVQAYVYIGGTRGLKVAPPPKNESPTDKIERIKNGLIRERYDETTFRKIRKIEAQVIEGIRKNVFGDLEQADNYNLILGITAYLDVIPPQIASKPNETVIVGFRRISLNKRLREKNNALRAVLYQLLTPHIKAVLNPRASVNDPKAQRGKAMHKLVKTMLQQLGTCHPEKNPAEVNMSAEMPKLITLTHKAAKVEAMQNQIPTEAQSELAGKIEVWNYTGIKASGFRWAASEDDKMRAEFVKKIILVVTNSHTSRNTLFDIANRRGRFDPGDDEMVFWVHYTSTRHSTATFWYSQQIEQALQQLKADQGVRAMFEQMMLRGIDDLGKTLTQVCAAVHYVTKMLTDFIKAGQIPEKYWNREHKDYVKSMRWVLAILTIDLSGGELATRYFAFSCGLWNGTLKTVGDITGMVSMFTGYVSDPKLRDQMDTMFKKLKNKGFFNLIGEQFSKHFSALGKVNHKSFYLLGEDVIFILSMATGAGELGLFAKGGKLVKIGQGLNNAVKGGKAALTVAQNSVRLLRRQLAAQVKVVYRKTSQAYDIVASGSGKVIATLQGGSIKVRKWINTTKDKILHPKSLDDSPDGKFIAKNEKGELGVCNKKGKACFVAGTLILTRTGYKKIETIKVGDWVWSYNEQTGKPALKQVSSTVKLKATALVILQVGKERIYTTPEHPFYLAGKWIQAGNLKKGDRLHLFQTRSITLSYLTKIDTSATVYNFAVADNHNYFVGQSKVLVHNSNGCGDLLARTNNQALKNKINALGDDKAKFLDDFKDVSDDVLAKFEGTSGLVDAWKVVQSDKKLRKSTEVLEKILKHERNPDNFTSFDLLANDFKVVKDKEAWVKSLDDEVEVVVKPKGDDVDLITSSNPKKQRKITLIADFLRKMGKNNEEINLIIDPIDLSKGVSIIPIKKGSKVWRYERIGDNVISKEKHFFTDSYGADTGIQAVGFKDPSGYELVTYEVLSTTSVLKTKIKRINFDQYISGELQHNIKEISRVKAH